MKAKHILPLLFFYLTAIPGLMAQDNGLMTKTREHFRRMDSISKQLEGQFEHQMQNLAKDSVTADLLNKTLDNYADNWDYALFTEMERFRRDLGVEQEITPETGEEEATRIFRRIIKIIPKENKSTPEDTVKTVKKVKVSKARTHMESVFRWGLNNTMDPTDSTGYKTWGSKFVALGFEIQYPLDRHGHVEALTGLGVLWNKLSPGGNYYHRVVNDKVYRTQHSSGLIVNKLRTSWLYGNVGLRFNPGRHFSIGAEAYGKLRLGSKQKLSYRDGYAYYKVSEQRDFTENRLNYGFSVFAGTRGLQLSFGMDMLPYFQNQNFRIYQVGIILR